MKRLLAVLAVALVALVGLPSAAGAHPLGNATVNHYDGLTFTPDHIDDISVEDVAEIPTPAAQGDIDTDGDGTLSDAERAAYAAKQCAAMIGGKTMTVGGSVKPWTIVSSDYTEKAGQAGLMIGELRCQLQASANLSEPTTTKLTTTWDSDGIGWHEITAVAAGVALDNSPVPATSISAELQAYPTDLLSSPLNTRSATIVTSPDGISTYAKLKKLPVAGFFVKAINSLDTHFNRLVSGHLTVWVTLLAILLSMLLGAGHAFLPGHGKTIMAAYLVGKRGRLRDVAMVGATVTITHTLGVLAMGAAISLSAAFAPTAVLQDLSVISGLTVVAVGLGLLVTAIKRRRTAGETIAEGFARATALPELADELAHAHDLDEVRELAGVGALAGVGHDAAYSVHMQAHDHGYGHGEGDGEGEHVHDEGDVPAHEHAGGTHVHADGEVHADHSHADHSHAGHEHGDHSHGDHADHSHGDHGDHPHGDHAEHSHGDHAGHEHDHGGHSHGDHAGHDQAAHDQAVHDHGDHVGHDHGEHAGHAHGEHEAPRKSWRQRFGGWIAGGHSHGPDGHSHGPGGHTHGPGGHDHGSAGHDHGAAGHDHGADGHDHGSGGHDQGGSGHSHAEAADDRIAGGGFSRLGLIGLGAAGGLVPSPSALIVLLSTIEFGRTVFGIVLVLAYGLGMALALTSAGLLVVSFQARIAGFMTGRRIGRLSTFAGALPIATAVLVMVVGFGLVARAATGNV